MLSLRLRFFFVLGAFAVAVIGLFAGVYYSIEKNETRAAQGREQARASEKLAGICQWVRLASSPVIAVHYVSALKRDPEVLFAACLSPAGTVSAHSDPQWIGRAWPQTAEFAANAREKVSRLGDEVRWSRPVFIDSQLAGYAVLGFSAKLLEAELAARLRVLFRHVLLVASAVFALALVLSVALAASLAGPIRELMRASRELGAGKLDFRSPLSARGDELGVLAGEMNSMAERLQKLDDFKDEVVAAISHDLRNPLAAIKTYAQVMKDGGFGSTSAEQSEALALIMDGADRLEALVENVLDSAKIKAGELKVSRQAVALAPLIERSLTLFKLTADAKALALKAQVPADLPRAWVDPDGIGRVLTNLISNAIKFTPKGGSITVRAAAKEGLLQVEVEDTGVGIPADKIEKVFTPFERFGQDGQTKGAGLGLVVSKKIVEAHGGTIEVRSPGGKGAVFSFSVPSQSHV